MNKHHPALSNSAGESDDFGLINGIGESIAGALHRSGIRRFSELALFTPEELAERIQDSVSIAPVQRIVKGDWIGQARDLAKKKIIPIVPKQLPDGRHDLANFVVIFEEAVSQDGQTKIQTIINHEQSDQSERWDGVAADALIQWMLSKANLPGQSSVEAVEKHQYFLPETDHEEEIELTLTDLWVSQTSPSMQSGDLPQKLVQVEGKLNIGGPDAINVTYERVPFIIEFHLITLESNRSNLVATYNWQLEPNNLIYSFQKNFPVPKRGRYRLHLTSKLVPPLFTAEAQLQGPVLRVGAQ